MALFSVKDLVEANLYESESAAVDAALRHLLRERADLRVKLAVHQYQHSDLSLAKAALIAGVSWVQMREILLERGAPVRLGPETLEEARDEVEVLRRRAAAKSLRSARRTRKVRG